MNVFCRIEPNMGGHDAQENMLARTNIQHTDVLSLEIGDVADAFFRKQFEAPDMLAAHNRDRLSGIDWNNECRGIVSREVDLVACKREGGWNAGSRCNIAN